MATKESGVVKWPAYLAVVPLFILAFAPQWGPSPYLAVAVSALLGGLGVFLSLGSMATKRRLPLTLLGFVLTGVFAAAIAALLSLRH